MSAQEGMALFSMPTPPEEEDDWYARELDGSFVDIGPVTPPASGPTDFSEVDSGLPAATADLSHVIWVSGHSSAFPEDLHEYVGAGNAEPVLVNVDEEGRPLGCEGTASLGGGGSRWNDLSADGSTVYFTCGGSLYARVDGGEPGAQTVTISAPQCGAGAAGAPCRENEAHPSGAEFMGASTDGSRAFFLSPQQLTDEASEGASVGCAEAGSDCNLYLYDSDLPVGHELIDVSAPERGEESPGVQGVVATSADGSHVYFVANGVLTHLPNGRGEKAAPGHCRSGAGRCSLYLYERDERYPGGHVAFVASIPGSDEHADWEANGRKANVTPEGRFLVFESSGELTPDTHDPGGGQVYRYDAETEQLVRVSIGEDGYDDDGNGGFGSATIVAAGKSEDYGTVPDRGDPTMSNDASRVFFESPAGLTQHALNDAPIGGTGSGGTGYAENVYEWEQSGVGSCPAGQSAGCVYLISDGRDLSVTGEETDPGSGCGEHTGSVVCLLGSDESGANVFFATADQLVPKDTDTQVDIYDARICETGNPCVTEPSPPLPPCQDEQCHGIPPERSPLLTGGSETFNGKGNIVPIPVKPVVKPLTRAQKLTDALRACRKDRKKSKRVACEKSARKKYVVNTNAKGKKKHAGGKKHG